MSELQTEVLNYYKKKNNLKGTYELKYFGVDSDISADVYYDDELIDTIKIDPVDFICDLYNGVIEKIAKVRKKYKLMQKW